MLSKSGARAWCAPHLTGHLAGGFSTEADKLPRGSELQAGVRVDLAIIFDPIGEHCKDCVGIMQDVEASVIALERFDEALRDAVAFGAADRCEEQGQAESARDVGSVLGDVGTSVIGQPFDWMWRACAFEPALDGAVRSDWIGRRPAYWPRSSSRTVLPIAPGHLRQGR